MNSTAHCVRGLPENYLIVAGRHNQSEIVHQEQWCNITQIILHPEYNPYAYDIALVQIFPPFEYNLNVQPATIAPRGFDALNVTGD